MQMDYAQEDGRVSTEVDEDDDYDGDGGMDIEDMDDPLDVPKI